MCRSQLRLPSFKLPSASNPDCINDVTDQRSGDVAEATLREYGTGQKLFGRYTLLKILGRGGMGIVWLARDEELERDVALKFLPDLIMHDRALLNQLKPETKRSLELTHKNIVRIYDFVHDERSGCISMEYVEGETLSNLRAAKDYKVFEPDELAPWMPQLRDALDYAHNYAKPERCDARIDRFPLDGCMRARRLRSERIRRRTVCLLKAHKIGCRQCGRGQRPPVTKS
jgi:Protein kinase domain